jgi:hypothetical protein
VGSYSYYDSLDILAVSGGISEVSVDTGNVVANQTSVTITPDGDGTSDVAYINFQFPAAFRYMVELSSCNFDTVARTFFGFGDMARIPWYGDLDNFNFGAPDMGPAGTYQVKIMDESGYLSDQSLSIIVSAGGITGRVLDSSNQPIANAEIRMNQNTLKRFSRTNSAGEYTL